MKHFSVKLLPHVSVHKKDLDWLNLQANFSIEANKFFIHYQLIGATSDLLLATYQSELVNKLGTDLWQHSCFELFIGYMDSSAYDEWNFSPSGSYAHYSFSKYRQLANQANCQFTIQSKWQRSAKHLDLLQQIDLLEFSKKIDKCNFSAVVETKTGEKIYFAQKQSKESADFHDKADWLTL